MRPRPDNAKTIGGHNVAVVAPCPWWAAAELRGNRVDRFYSCTRVRMVVWVPCYARMKWVPVAQATLGSCRMAAGAATRW